MTRGKRRASCPSFVINAGVLAAMPIKVREAMSLGLLGGNAKVDQLFTIFSHDILHLRAAQVQQGEDRAAPAYVQINTMAYMQ